MKVRSFSIPDEIDLLIRQRSAAERMTVSEFLRKCIREEAERSRARQLLGALDPLNALSRGLV